jgi:ribosomal protein S26
MAIITTGKCFECGEKTKSEEHYFCRECFRELKASEKIEECKDCGTWHYANGDCLCHTNFVQCNKCGRWINSDDKCICEIEPANVKKNYIKKTQDEGEVIFRKKLEQVIDNEKYGVETQKHLRQLVDKPEKWKWAPELNKAIDFIITDKAKNYEPVLLIELNGTSHDNPERKESDRKKKYICDEAGVKIKFITRDDNMTLDYLRAKLEDWLE